MKDLFIAIVILAILTVLFSMHSAPPEQGTPPSSNAHGSGFKEPGESEQIQQGEGDKPVQSISEPTTPPPDYTELALEVIRGDWGNGYIRKQRLREAGHDAEAVQEVVNNMLK